MLSSWKTDITATTMFLISKALLKGESRFELNLLNVHILFIIIVWVISYWFYSLVLYIFHLDFVSLVGTSVKYLFPLLSSTNPS